MLKMRMFGWLCLFFFPLVSLAENVSCLGQIVPGQRVIDVAAPAYAIVGELLVKRGSLVRTGDILAVLRDAPVMQAKLDSAYQQVALAKAELALVRAGERPELIAAQASLVAAHRAEATLMESRLEHFRTLVSKKLYEQDRYDEISSELKVVRARIQRETSILDSLGTSRAEVVSKAEISVKLAEAGVAEASALLYLQQIRSPINGEVLNVQRWPGESVGESGILLSVGDTNDMQALAEVNESDLSRVKLGSRALINSNAFTGDIGGEVIEIARIFDSNRLFAIDPSAYVDRRIAIVRIRPDQPDKLSALSQANVVITILAP